MIEETGWEGSCDVSGFRVRIARFPGGQSEHPAAAQWVIDTSRQIADDPMVDDLDHWWVVDTPIPMLRNLCVQESLADGIDYLLMIDRDMAPDVSYEGSRPFWSSSWAWMMERREQEQATRAELLATSVRPDEPAAAAAALAAHPPATIAAPYCGPPAHCFVYVWRWDGAGVAVGQTADVGGQWETHPDVPGGVTWVQADDGARMVMVASEDAASKRGTQRVAALPAGLILYDLRVFTLLPPPWFSYEYTDEYQSVKASPEDVRQTRRAGLMGMPQLCNWDAWAGHVKLGTIQRPGGAGDGARPSGIVDDPPVRYRSDPSAMTPTPPRA
jgi:hypothetical protein